MAVRGGGVKAAEPPVVVNVNVALLPGVTDDGETEQFMPCAVGEEQLSVMSPPNPACRTVVSVRVVDPPAGTGGMVAGEISNRKSGSVALSCTAIALSSAVDTKSAKLSLLKSAAIR